MVYDPGTHAVHIRKVLIQHLIAKNVSLPAVELQAPSVEPQARLIKVQAPRSREHVVPVLKQDWPRVITFTDANAPDAAAAESNTHPGVRTPASPRLLNSRYSYKLQARQPSVRGHDAAQSAGTTFKPWSPPGHNT